MIRLDKVTKLYNEGQESEVRAVDAIDLSIALDRVTVLKGPSGSGKTTLLTLIGGLARPTSGRIHIGDELVSNLPEKFLTQLRRRRFGFIFQRFNLIRGLSVVENVMLPAYPLAPDHHALREQALERLARLDLASKAAVSVEHLSGGEAQRTAIARALINDPSVIIADEPTANLDSRLAAQFLAIVRQLRQEGRTVIMTSHDPRIWQDPLVDRVISMEDGRIVGDSAA